jgi:hypothetical protein
VLNDYIDPFTARTLTRAWIGEGVRHRGDHSAAFCLAQERVSRFDISLFSAASS